MSKLVKMFPPDLTYHNGRRADPDKGLDIPQHEVEYLVAAGWRKETTKAKPRAVAKIQTAPSVVTEKKES